MDENSRRRRQNEPPYMGSSSDPRFGASQSQGRGFTGSSTDRYRDAPLTTGSPSGGRSSGGSGGTGAYSGYYQEPSSSFGSSLPTNTLQYSQGYSQDQRQQQGFTTYNTDLMYNVAQPSQQSAVYDSSQQFPARQPAAMQLLSEVAAPYFPNEPTSAPGPPALQHHASSTSTGVYQQHHQSPSDRSMIQQGYPSQLTIAGLPQPAQDMMEEDDFQAQGPGMEAAYTAYQTALKEIFQNIMNGRLATAAQSLLDVSEWLLGHVGDLGLTVDEHALHSDRIRLWGEFNTAWLSIFQKQKDMLEAGQRIQHPQNLMTQETISKMAKDLIRMCDAVEKHGLVDYQYGVAEEQIITILTECLDVQEAVEGGGQNPGAGPP